jgi:hypothetical protein
MSFSSKQYKILGVGLMRHDVKPKQPKQLTVRLSSDEAAILESALKSKNISANKLIAELLTGWAGTAEHPGQDETLLSSLVTAVTEALRRDPTWAKQAINAASLGVPRESVYYARVGHFQVEKEALAEKFLPWLVERVNHHLRSGGTVGLLIESGTTLKALLDELGPKLKEIDLTAWSGRVEIITNNFPGAESYEAYGRDPQNKIKLNGRETQISDEVPCHLVPGRVLGEYEAVVGSEAEEYVRHKKWKSVGAEGSVRNQTANSKEVLIGVTTGNWVMLQGSSLRPIPLARGWGHRRFKEAVIGICDEVFLISPLCKIFQRGLDEFNRDFIDAAPGEEMTKGRYEEVALPSSARLVTTYRGMRTSIVYNHSKTVRRGLGAENDKEEDYGALTQKPIEEVPHLFYKFDRNSEDPEETQKEKEFPHERTRKEPFLTRYFL